MFASLCMFHVPHFTFALFLSFPLVWYTVTIQHTDAVLGCETQVKPASQRKESRHKLSSVARGGWRLVMNSGTESATNKASSSDGCTCAGRVGDVAGLCSDWDGCEFTTPLYLPCSTYGYCATYRFARFDGICCGNVIFVLGRSCH